MPLMRSCLGLRCKWSIVCDHRMLMKPRPSELFGQKDFLWLSLWRFLLKVDIGWWSTCLDRTEYAKLLSEKQGPPHTVFSNTFGLLRGSSQCTHSLKKWTLWSRKRIRTAIWMECSEMISPLALNDLFFHRHILTIVCHFYRYLKQ